MPVSRGSVQHPLYEDILAFFATRLLPSVFCRRASKKEKSSVAEKAGHYLGANHVTMVPFARTGLYSVLKALGLPKGSEVLMTPINIGPMCEVVESLGLKPRFVDLDSGNYGPDLSQLEKSLEEKPAVFLLTYLFGFVPNIERITKLCRDKQTFLIEDFSQNIGAEFDGAKLGTFGDAAIYSASLLKYVDGYNGGFVISKSKELAEKVEIITRSFSNPNPTRIKSIVFKTLIWNIALKRMSFTLLTFPALSLLRRLSRKTFDKILGPSIQTDLKRCSLPSYYFEDISKIQCQAISRALSRLDALVESRINSANNAMRAAQETLGESTKVIGNRNSIHTVKNTYWQLLVPVRDAELAKSQLFSAGIETGTTNLPDLSALYDNDLPVASEIKKSHLFIPLHRHLSQRHYLRICNIVRTNLLCEN